MAKFKVGDRVRFTNACPTFWWFGPSTEHKDGVVVALRKGGYAYNVKCEGEDTKALVDDEHIELVEPELRLEAGKSYRTRDGRKVGPMMTFGDKGRFIAKEGDGRVWEEDGAHYFWYSTAATTADDLIAEWAEEESLGDILAEAFGTKGGPAARSGKTRKDLLFLKGDVVECLKDCEGQFTRGKRYVVANDYPAHSRYYDNVEIAEDDSGRTTNGWCRDYFRRVDADKPAQLSVSISGVGRWTITPKNPTAIVALIEDGQPKPSDRPYVHASRDAAEKEASRLANKHKAKTFGVYELVSSSCVLAPVYKHEWQRLAAGGSKVAAIIELRTISGLGLAEAKTAIEYWIAREAA